MVSVGAPWSSPISASLRSFPAFSKRTLAWSRPLFIKRLSLFQRASRDVGRHLTPVLHFRGSPPNNVLGDAHSSKRAICGNCPAVTWLIGIFDNQKIDITVGTCIPPRTASKQDDAVGIDRFNQSPDDFIQNGIVDDDLSHVLRPSDLRFFHRKRSTSIYSLAQA